MNITNWLLLIVTALTLASLTWWGCAWWYGRKLADLRQRMEKLRSAAGRHATQMRQQIGLLKKELADRQPLTASNRSAQDEAQQRRAALSNELDVPTPAERRPAHGFADTQPFA